MKTFLIAAITADGFIAKNSAHMPSWTSKEDKKFFVERTKQAGVVIMGSKTFEVMGRPLKDRLNIVYSRDPNKKYEGAEVTNKPPAELLRDLEARGFHEAAICGGSNIYTMFLKAGLLDTLYITIEPLLFGSGVTILNEPVEAHLKLVSSKMLSDNVVLLEYGCLNQRTNTKKN